MWRLEMLIHDILYFIDLMWLEEKHHKLRYVLLNFVIPLILSIITSLLTTKLIVSLVGL